MSQSKVLHPKHYSIRSISSSSPSESAGMHSQEQLNKKVKRSKSWDCSMNTANQQRIDKASHKLMKLFFSKRRQSKHTSDGDLFFTDDDDDEPPQRCASTADESTSVASSESKPVYQDPSRAIRHWPSREAPPTATSSSNAEENTTIRLPKIVVPRQTLLHIAQSIYSPYSRSEDALAYQTAILPPPPLQMQSQAFESYGPSTDSYLNQAIDVSLSNSEQCIIYN